jgi:hypothetical protein
MRPLALLLVAGCAAALAAPAWAGPPYVTDDPQPTERGHWEIYNFVTGTHLEGDTSGEAGLDFNYGGAEDLQLTLVIPAAYDRSEGETHVGMGVVEAAAKLKIVHQDKDSWRPDVAVFPRLFLPTAPARFASRHANLLLPVWAEKDFGPWAVFGGGGFQLNPGSGNRDFWTGGIAVTRQVSARLNLGAEITHRTRDASEGRDFTGANLGVIYKLTDHWSLLASGGPGLQNARSEGRYDFYVSLKADY